MKPIALLLLFWLIFTTQSGAQTGCQTVPLGELYEKLKHIDVSKVEPLKHKKYPSFSFKDFKPIEGKVIESNFFEIGFNNKGEIREIIHREKKDSLTNYRMLVFDYPNCRILTLGPPSDGIDDAYSSAVFVLDKRSRFNYMVNTDAVFGNPMILQSVGGITYKGIEDLSVLMILDQDLFSTDIFRVSEGRIVFYSEVKYKKAREIDYEQARLFLPSTRHEDLKIGPNSCPVDLLLKISVEPEDMYFKLYPSDRESMKFAPLWIRLGVPNYR